MADIKEHMTIIGKDGAHVGTVEGDVVKLSVNADAVQKTEESGQPV